MEIECFMVELTDRCERYLCREAAQDGHVYTCSVTEGVHSARRRVEDGELRLGDAGEFLMPPGTWGGDPRWPTRCECGLAFRDEDEWHVQCEPIYRRVGNGELYARCDLPFGAMYACPFTRNFGAGADGLSLVVITPSGYPGTRTHQWKIDGPAVNDPNGWSRTGVPPRLTVYGSCLVGSYHAFLRDGVLRDC